MALETAYCKLDAAKVEYINTKQKVKDSKEKEETPAPERRKKAKEPMEQADVSAPDVIADASTLASAKKTCEEAVKKVKEAKLAAATTGVKPFELYENLLSDKARLPWEKIIKAQVMQAPWEDVFRIPHTKTPSKD